MRAISSSPSAAAGRETDVRQRLSAKSPAAHFFQFFKVVPPSFLYSYPIGDLRVDGGNEHVYLLEQCHQQHQQYQNDKHCYKGEQQCQNGLADRILMHRLNGIEHQEHRPCRTDYRDAGDEDHLVLNQYMGQDRPDIQSGNVGYQRIGTVDIDFLDRALAVQQGADRPVADDEYQKYCLLYTSDAADEL